MSLPATFESSRQAAVRALAPDDFEGTAYDDLTRRAADLCHAAFAVISIVDGDRLLFKTRIGTDLAERPRRSSFCDHAIGDPTQVTIVEDAATDERFSANPNVTGAPFLRFYAGVPLIFRGQPIGTLCAFDTAPHVLDVEDVRELCFLAEQVMVVLEQRRTSRATGAG